MIARGRKHSDDYFNTANGCISAEYAMPVPDDLVNQIKQIKEAFPEISKENAAIVLQSCDCNLEKAVSMLSQDGGEAILSSWSLQGKKGKNGQSKGSKRKNRKHRNRQQNALESKKNDVNESSALTGEDDKTKQVMEVSSSCTTGDIIPDREADTAKFAPSVPKSSSSKHLESDYHPPKPLPQTVEKVKSTRTTAVSSKVGEPTKKETNVIDSMPRSSKDLQRSAVALSRFHTKHEEKCIDAEKKIKSQFSKMRESLFEREKLLLEELEKVKVEAARLLNERQDQAAHLQMQCKQVVRLPTDEVQELRAEIKLFVGDRKIDEELATSDRFIGNCQDIVEENPADTAESHLQRSAAIGKFGQINPLKTDYKPRTAVLTPQVSTEGEKITRDNVRETSADGLKAKDLQNAKPARVENGTKLVSTAELKERVETYSKLKEAVHEQACKGAGKVSTDSHEEHSKSEVGDRNVVKDTRVVEKRNAHVAENRSKVHETNFSGNGTSTKQLKAQNEERSFDHRQSHQPPYRRNGRQNNRRDRRSQSARHLDNDNWNFFDESNDSASTYSSQRLNDKRGQRPFDERPDHRQWRRDEDLPGRRKSAREERSSKGYSIRQDDRVVDENKSVDTKQDVRETDRENLKNSAKSSSNAQSSLESFKDQNNNVTRDINDSSKTDRNRSGRGSKDFDDRAERNYPRKEGKASSSRGNNFHRRGSEFHRYQNRQNHKGAFVEEVSSSEYKSKDDRKKTEPNGQDVESNAVLTKERQEKRVDERHSKARQTEDREDRFVESAVVEKVHKSNDRGRNHFHDQQRRSADKSEKSPEHLPQKKNTTQRYSRRPSHSDRYRECNGYKRDMPPRMKYSSQRAQRNEKVGDELKKVHANIESDSGHVPEKGTDVASKSWADEVLQEDNFKCNGHVDQKTAQSAAALKC